ncbi:WG repeat-containing protein [Nonlabens ponticola]|uniref:Toxin-antitoxin system YwqK family antitoxin n=1 Tax=Nonlabens ponticola TaxID=2496866 RepID=A0A3S9MU81_9FLAO|nr:WG repeat-containing protein [Nonlabens ponticola]AZQ42739.1 hypothetical protein EJ995_00220 [Nonlabens ponticola]
MSKKSFLFTALLSLIVFQGFSQQCDCPEWNGTVIPELVGDPCSYNGDNPSLKEFAAYECCHKNCKAKQREEYSKIKEREQKHSQLFSEYRQYLNNKDWSGAISMADRIIAMNRSYSDRGAQQQVENFERSKADLRKRIEEDKSSTVENTISIDNSLSPAYQDQQSTQTVYQNALDNYNNQIAQEQAQIEYFNAGVQQAIVNAFDGSGNIDVAAVVANLPQAQTEAQGYTNLAVAGAATVVSIFQERAARRAAENESRQQRWAAEYALVKDGEGLYDKVGRKQGVWTYYSKQMLPQVTGKYIDGKKDGIWVELEYTPFKSKGIWYYSTNYDDSKAYLYVNGEKIAEYPVKSGSDTRPNEFTAYGAIVTVDGQEYEVGRWLVYDKYDNEYIEGFRNMKGKQGEWKARRTSPNDKGRYNVEPVHEPLYGYKYTRENLFFEDNLSHGTFTSTYVVSKTSEYDVLTRGQFYQGKKVGKWYYYQKIQEGATFLSDILSYKDDKLNGLQQSFYRSEGEPKLKETYVAVDGLKNGFNSFYDVEGNMLKKAQYKDGILNGEQVTYYKNGTIRMIGSAVDGEMDGEMQLFYINGDRNIEGFYSKGKPKGEFTFYRDDNKFLQVGLKDNMYHGLKRSFTPEGKVISQGEFDNGVAIGTHFMKNSQGDKDIYKLTYNKGELKEKTGQLLSTDDYVISLNNGKYDDAYKFTNDQKTVIGTYDNGLRVGSWEIIDNARVTNLKFEENGLRDGAITIVDGSAKTIGQYEQDLPVGLWETTQSFQSGELQERFKFQYINGKKDGEWFKEYRKKPGKKLKTTSVKYYDNGERTGTWNNSYTFITKVNNRQYYGESEDNISWSEKKSFIKNDARKLLLDNFPETPFSYIAYLAPMLQYMLEHEISQEDLDDIKENPKKFKRAIDRLRGTYSISIYTSIENEQALGYSVIRFNDINIDFTPVLDQFGEIVFIDEFEFMNVPVQGLTAAKRQGKWGYLNSKFETVIPFVYMDAKPFKNGIAQVTDEFGAYYINASGEKVIDIWPLKYDAQNSNPLEMGVPSGTLEP